MRTELLRIDGLASKNFSEIDWLSPSFRSPRSNPRCFCLERASFLIWYDSILRVLTYVASVHITDSGCPQYLTWTTDKVMGHPVSMFKSSLFTYHHHVTWFSCFTDFWTLGAIFGNQLKHIQQYIKLTNHADRSS